MKTIRLTDTQAVLVRDGIRTGNTHHEVHALDPRTARSLYAKGLTDSPGYEAHLSPAGQDVARQLKMFPGRRTFHVEPPAKVVYKMQPADRPDGMSEDGHVRYQKPWPVVARPDGSVVGADEQWCGKVTKVIGFQQYARRQRIDLHWDDFLLDPQQAVRMYLVTSDKDGAWGSHDTAVEAVTEVQIPEGE